MAKVYSSDSKHPARLLARILAAAFCVLLAMPAVTFDQAFGDGEGSATKAKSGSATAFAVVDTSWYENDPSAIQFYIRSLDELLGLAYLANEAGVSFEGRTITLTADIDAAEVAQWVPIAKGERSGRTFVPAGMSVPFAGTFDGGGHSISNITMSESQGSSDFTYGLFGCVDGGTVKNLTLQSATIRLESSELAAAAIGMLIGGGTASGINVDASSSISALRGVGAIVGRMIADGTIANCTNNATVGGTGANIGGIVGAAYYTSADKEMSIIGCTNNGTVFGAGLSASVIGGIVGLSSANIANCTNTATIMGEVNAALSVGGIVGEQQVYGSVSGNVNADTATVSGSMAGGIVGWLRYASYSPEDYERFEMIAVSDNENHAAIESLDGGLKSAGGIIGSLYDYADVVGNRNYAPNLATYNFVAGIVGSIQAGNSPLGFEQSVRVEDNLSTTRLADMEYRGGGSLNRGLHAYNNVPRFASVVDNYIEILETPEEALTLIESVLGPDGEPTREMVNAVTSSIRHADKSVRDGLNTATAAESLAVLEEATYQYNNSPDERMIRETTVAHNPLMTPGLLEGGSASGAALSIKVLSSGQRTSGMANMAVLELSAPTYVPDEPSIPVPLASGSPKIIFDASLDFVDDNDNLVQESVQPTIPLTLRFILDGAIVGSVNPERLVIISFHKNEGTQEMQHSLVPIYSVEEIDGNYRVEAGFTQLSTVLVGVKGDVSVYADNVEVPYDGLGHGVDARTYIDNVVIASAVITYFDGTDYTLSASPLFTDATQGPQTVLFKAAVLGYEDVYGEATVTVNKANLTVFVEGLRKTEAYTGETLSAAGFSYDNSDKVLVELKPGSRAYVEAVEVGVYTMGLSANSFVVTDLTGDNHNIALMVTDGYLEIIQAGSDKGAVPSDSTRTAALSQIAKVGDPLSTVPLFFLASSIVAVLTMLLLAGILRQRQASDSLPSLACNQGRTKRFPKQS